MELKVEGHTNLYRDSETGAIIVKDKNSYQNYMDNIRSRLYNKTVQENLVDDVKKLKNDMNNINGLLQKIMEKLDDR
jgi:predicted transcriptional regulator